MTDNIIEIDSLNKRYGSLKAVNDLSFKVKRGELFAFLGVNGAGKSTTINIMCGQLSKDSGKVMIDGRDMDREAAGSWAWSFRIRSLTQPSACMITWKAGQSCMA